MQQNSVYMRITASTRNLNAELKIMVDFFVFQEWYEIEESLNWLF